MGRTKEDDDVLLNFVDNRTSRQAAEALERNLLVALGARRGRSFHTAIRFRGTIAEGNVKCPSSTREDTNFAKSDAIPSTFRRLKLTF